MFLEKICFMPCSLCSPSLLQVPFSRLESELKFSEIAILRLTCCLHVGHTHTDFQRQRVELSRAEREALVYADETPTSAEDLSIWPLTNSKILTQTTQ